MKFFNQLILLLILKIHMNLSCNCSLDLQILIFSLLSLLILPTITKPSVFSYPHRLAPEKLKVVKTEWNHMLQLGLICPSSSLLYIVPNRAMDFCPVEDFLQTQHHNSSRSLFYSLFSRIFCDFAWLCYLFLNLTSLVHTYHQIPVDVPYNSGLYTVQVF